jgi:hypothetical protein
MLFSCFVLFLDLTAGNCWKNLEVVIFNLDEPEMQDLVPSVVIKSVEPESEPPRQSDVPVTDTPVAPICFHVLVTIPFFAATFRSRWICTASPWRNT